MTTATSALIGTPRRRVQLLDLKKAKFDGKNSNNMRNDDSNMAEEVITRPSGHASAAAFLRDADKGLWQLPTTNRRDFKYSQEGFKWARSAPYIHECHLDIGLRRFESETEDQKEMYEPSFVSAKREKDNRPGVDLPSTTISNHQLRSQRLSEWFRSQVKPLKPIEQRVQSAAINNQMKGAKEGPRSRLFELRVPMRFDPKLRRADEFNWI